MIKMLWQGTFVSYKGKYEESGDESENLTAEENNTDALQILDDCFEDLFEDEETGYTTCRLIVAKAGDTYGSIAQRYGVDEKQLRERNQEKEVNAKMLVMLPWSNRMDWKKYGKQYWHLKGFCLR